MMSEKEKQQWRFQLRKKLLLFGLLLTGGIVAILLARC